MRRTPLAWKNLVHQPRRLAVAACGVAFAVLLMFMELGFLFALLDSTVQVIRRLNADLIMVSTAKFAVVARERFPLQRLHQAQACPEITAVPLYMETVGAVIRQPDHKGHPIRVLAFVPGDDVFNIPEVRQNQEQLGRPYTALVDLASKRDYGFPEADQPLDDFRAELLGRRLQLVGRFRLSTDFATDGNLIMTADNFARYFPLRAPGDDPLNVVDIGLIRLGPGTNVEQAQACLKQLKLDGVEILTRDEFIRHERSFWLTATPIGYIFLVGTIIGFVVGVIVCYQIIFADLDDHMGEFATLRAMGYTNRYFVGLVLSESAYLSLLGFIPGAIISFVLYQILARSTGLFMVFRPEVALLVLLATLIMCSLSGLFAMRKLLSVDPASLF
jgi:putative ABC transport system permease protein